MYRVVFCELLACLLLCCQELMPLSQLSRELATTMQEFTQQGCVLHQRALSVATVASATLARAQYALPHVHAHWHELTAWRCCSGVRPFGVSLLAAGYDDDGPHLYQIDPSGSYWAWKASAIGKNMVNAKTFLEKRYNEDIEIEDAIHTAILTLKVRCSTCPW